MIIAKTFASDCENHPNFHHCFKFTVNMSNVFQESKQLYLELKENEDKYTNEELDIRVILDKTDALYENLYSGAKLANDYLQDSDLLSLETKIVRQSTRICKVHALSFDPRNFSMRTLNFFSLGNADENPEGLRRKSLATLWKKLGKYSKEIMYTVPNFNFIHGTFDVDPIEPVKKKRKQKIKDKLGDITQPKQLNINEITNGQDVMCTDASRILSCFINLTRKSEKKAVCFYEFVIDPKSFTRTVEYIFLVSLLVQHGDLSIFEDDQGLPYLKLVEDKHSQVWNNTAAQTALTISKEEWESLIKTFNFKNPVIPPRITR